MADLSFSLQSPRSAVAQARTLLAAQPAREPIWPLLAAAAVAAGAALALAAAVILGPPQVTVAPQPSLKLRPSLSRAGQGSVEPPRLFGRAPQRPRLV